MGERSYWPGHVENRSDQYLWVMWDEEATDNGRKVKKWFARILSPKRKTPDSLDIDGVTAHDPGKKINGSDQWWWLNGGAEVKIMNRSDGSLFMKQDSTFGSLSEVSQMEIDKWGVNYDVIINDKWGDPV